MFGRYGEGGGERKVVGELLGMRVGGLDDFGIVGRFCGGAGWVFG